MAIESPRLTLLAPGCFSTVKQANEGEQQAEHTEASPEVNNSRVSATATKAYEQALAEALQQPIPALGELPIAQHSYTFDTGVAPPSHCVCAEFIHLQADKDNARLFPMPALGITDDESEQLMGTLNDLIREDGVELLRTNGNRYYLTGMSAEKLDTWPAHTVASGKIADYLPRQAEAGAWRRLMTEVQMLFHDHPVNIERGKNQQLAINGMWFWGGRQLTDYKLVHNLTVVTSDAYACGLAQALGVQIIEPEKFDWANIENDTVIIELAVYHAWLKGDHEALRDAKNTLHDQWITPSQNALAARRLSEFVLDGCEGQSIVEVPRPAKKKSFFERLSFRNLFTSSDQR